MTRMKRGSRVKSVIHAKRHRQGCTFSTTTCPSSFFHAIPCQCKARESFQHKSLKDYFAASHQHPSCQAKRQTMSSVRSTSETDGLHLRSQAQHKSTSPRLSISLLHSILVECLSVGEKESGFICLSTKLEHNLQQDMTLQIKEMKYTFHAAFQSHSFYFLDEKRKGCWLFGGIISLMSFESHWLLFCLFSCSMFLFFRENTAW